MNHPRKWTAPQHLYGVPNGPFSTWGRGFWFGFLLPTNVGSDSFFVLDGSIGNYYRPDQAPNALHADGHVTSHRRSTGYGFGTGWFNTELAEMLTFDRTTNNW